MHKLRKRKDFKIIMAAFVIISLLFQIYLSATIVLNPGQITQSNWLNKLQGEKVLLCTTEGFKWVNINDVIQQNQSQSLSSSTDNLDHQPLQYSCPILKACQYSLLLVVGLLCLLQAWLARYTPIRNKYQFHQCQQKVYLSLAPKHSPPLPL